MTELRPEPLAEYGGVIYKIGNVYLHRWLGRSYYFDRLEDAVEDALQSYSQEVSGYKRDCPGLRHARTAVLALQAGKWNVGKAAKEKRDG